MGLKDSQAGSGHFRGQDPTLPCPLGSTWPQVFPTNSDLLTHSCSPFLAMASSDPPGLSQLTPGTKPGLLPPLGPEHWKAGLWAGAPPRAQVPTSPCLGQPQRDCRPQSPSLTDQEKGRTSATALLACRPPGLLGSSARGGRTSSSATSPTLGHSAGRSKPGLHVPLVPTAPAPSSLLPGHCPPSFLPSPPRQAGRPTALSNGLAAVPSLPPWRPWWPRTRCPRHQHLTDT